MLYQKQIRNRKRNRLKGYNYSRDGCYFITICTKNRIECFGEIKNGEMALNKYGYVAEKQWQWLADQYAYVKLDEYIIMPNHFHGVIILEDINNQEDTARRVPTQESFGKPISGSVPSIIRSFKSAVTRLINLLSYPHKIIVWQNNYYEHTIRSEDGLNTIREYIQNNPLRWEYDRDNPKGKPDKKEEKFWKDFT